jgi:hypothetical protein
MEPNDALSAYRERLLGSLRQQPGRCYQEEPGSLQIFVNQECAGAVECGDRGAVALITQPRPVQTVDVRTAAGLLIASLSAQDMKFKIGRFPVGENLLEIVVHNGPDTGSVRVGYHLASFALQPGVQERPSPSVQRDSAEGVAVTWLSSLWLSSFRGPRHVMVARVGLAAVLVFLVGDRLADRLGHDAAVSEQVAATGSIKETLQASEAVLTSQRDMLAKVVEAQDAMTRTMQGQQQSLARAQKAVESLTVAQQELGEKVVGVSDRVAQLKDETSVVLAARTRELERGLKQQLVALSKMSAPSEPSKVLHAKPAESQPQQLADAIRDPFTFWVSFEDNTPENSIQDLLKEIHGRPGRVDSGWYNIEVNLPDRQTPDGFVDTLKKSKIVKAVKTSMNMPPNR